MDFSNNVVLKENYTFLVADAAGQITAGEHGVYNRDTRFLNRYSWSLGENIQPLLVYTPRPDTLSVHYALIEGPSQVLGLERQLKVRADGFEDVLKLQNTSSEPRSVPLKLAVAGDFADMFEARGWEKLERAAAKVEQAEAKLTLRYRAQDGAELGVFLEASQVPGKLEGDALVFSLELAPKETYTLSVTVTLQALGEDRPGVDYDTWLAGFSVPETLSQPHLEVLTQAQKDLRALLLFTEHGPYLAAGIPWYVAAFGRDALLAASMLLPHHPEVAEGVLRYLAAYQGQKYDAVTAEAPGKIMHELRFGELTRLGQTPFGPYYGTVDATALFVMLLQQLYAATGNLELVRELRPHWEAALSWLTDIADGDGDGFLEFSGDAAKGLAVQTWKDSWDSLSHKGGQLATGAIAGSEVQGYAYAAYNAAADFYDALGDLGGPDDQAGNAWRKRADTLKTSFHKHFWLDEWQTYALALDGDKRPLAVHNSNAGQLLWTGIVPDEIAPNLVKSLFAEVNWSGWGIRTLGTNEVRYNPVSYHNGSVWPHDTALIAGGLARYGFGSEVRRIKEALYDLAASQHDRRLPELVAGYARTDAPPVPYPVACRPQAWDAAALLYLLTL